MSVNTIGVTKTAYLLFSTVKLCKRRNTFKMSFSVANLASCYSEFKTVPEEDRQDCH